MDCLAIENKTMSIRTSHGIARVQAEKHSQSTIPGIHGSSLQENMVKMKVNR
jgi:hypothetical protein